VLIEPRGDLRATLLRDFVTQTSSAFRAAGAAARVLVLVPLLKLEATMAAPPSGTPERTALAARLERVLGASLSTAQPSDPRDLRPFELVGSEAWDPLQSRMLFCDPAGNLLRLAHADPPPMMDARELVAGMGARHCATLRAAWARAFPGAPPVSETAGQTVRWQHFSADCERAGITHLHAARPSVVNGQLCVISRFAELAVALQEAP